LEIGKSGYSPLSIFSETAKKHNDHCPNLREQGGKRNKRRVKRPGHGMLALGYGHLFLAKATTALYVETY
jgi:hypothetical protein